MAEYQASFEELEDEEEGGDKEFYLNNHLKEVEGGLDEGKLLVIRRALSGLATQDDFEQREAIFHPWCTVGGKVCFLIIDEGICAHVASQSLVEKLKLPYPKPYTI